MWVFEGAQAWEMGWIVKGAAMGTQAIIGATIVSVMAQTGGILLVATLIIQGTSFWQQIVDSSAGKMVMQLFFSSATTWDPAKRTLVLNWNW
jgi:hypothetical protein